MTKTRWTKGGSSRWIYRVVFFSSRWLSAAEVAERESQDAICFARQAALDLLGAVPWKRPGIDANKRTPS